ncbi:MAG: branched-chain amino acid ABC transporter permease [Firmicutes bacterium]|nr:branched-chain amino acid ABC transporter permease [Bacillota bacterium]
MATSLNLITGFTGQLSIGHAAFMSIGAYAAALATLKLGLPFFGSLFFGALLAAFFGVLIGVPTLKLKGDYLAIATLGFGEIVRIVFLNLKITGGAVGLRGVPKNTTILWVIVAAILTIFVLNRILKSRVGRALVAVREDETAAESMGINTTYYKILAFGVGAFFAGLGGGLFSHYFQYIHPNSFGFLRSIEHLCMVVLGGLGNIWGSIIGAAALTAIPEFLRASADYRQLFYGAILVLMMRIRPEGIISGKKSRKIPPGKTSAWRGKNKFLKATR